MTEKIYIKLPVLILPKEKKAMPLFWELASFFVVISVRFVLDCNSFFSLLTPQSSTYITLKNKFRLSVRFLHLNALRMIQFSVPNLNFENKITDNRAAEAFYCLSARSAISTFKLPNLH